MNVEVESPERDGVKKPSSSFQNRLDLLPFDDPDNEFTNWIADSIEKLGFKLGAEFFEESYAPFSRILFSKLWKGVANDILRRSLRECWKRTEGLKPDEIVLDDTFLAVTRRPEFDCLTNTGLGVSKNV